jgi:hypothetical protein
MKGRQGVSMQGIEYAPKKKGNVKCAECKHLIFRPSKPRKGQTKPSYYCEIKKQPRWYTAKCYCKQFEGGNDEQQN